MSGSAIAVSKSYLYDEFGDSLGARGSTQDKWRYTRQEYDLAPTYAYNLRAREYYPKIGRFMQNDPIRDRGGSLNWYLYVANNPINRSDPSGLCTKEQSQDELGLILNAYKQCKSEVKWAWGPWSNVQWCTTWLTGVPGHSCNQFVSEYSDCIERKMGVKRRCCELQFKHIFIHAWIYVKCSCGVGRPLDPWAGIP